MPIERLLGGTAQRSLSTEKNLERGRIVKCSKEVRFVFQCKICCNQMFLSLSFLRMNNLFIKPLFLLKNIFISDQVSHLLPIATDCMSTKFSRNFFSRYFLQKAELAKLVLKNILKKFAKKSFGSRFKKIDLNVTDYLL